MPDLPVYLEAHFRASVNDQLNAAIQQKESKFKNMGMLDTRWKNPSYSFTKRGLRTMKERTGITGGKQSPEKATASKRTGVQRKFYDALSFAEDEVDGIADENGLPTAAFIEDMVSAFGRTEDIVMLEAAQAQTLGGIAEPWTTVQPLPGNMIIPVTWNENTNGGTNTSLSLWKIQEAKTRMLLEDVDLDEEMLCLAISPRMQQQWFRHYKSASTDEFAKLLAPYFNNNKSPVLDCKVIVTNKLVKTAGTQIENAVLFTKRAMKTGGTTADVKIDVIADEFHSTLVTYYGKTKVVREFDELVKIIPCDLSVPLVA